MKKIYTFELKGDEVEVFEKAFEFSGMRSRSEFIRFLINAEIKEYYGSEK